MQTSRKSMFAECPPEILRQRLQQILQRRPFAERHQHLHRHAGLQIESGTATIPDKIYLRYRDDDLPRKEGLPIFFIDKAIG
ncbi:hypothetical protein [Aquisediminimonas sediminicola]|uniref:hypothetical protein n=1 Tax=Alteraquisediminimonas sediminicola TaxID=2676787 RepID=UPI001FEAA8A1|nr:hypothetical protein [Aquisediminimonas sediminicola]